MKPEILIFNDGDPVPEWLIEVEADEGGKLNTMHFKGRTLVVSDGDRYFVIPASTDKPAIFIDGDNIGMRAASKQVVMPVEYWIMELDGGDTVELSEL